MSGWVDDVRQGVRSSLRRPRELALPVATLAAVVALAVCLFSVVQGVLLRGLPFRGGDRFVLVATGPTEIDGTPLTDVRALRERIASGSSAFESLATSFALNAFVSIGERGTIGTTCGYVSADLFEFLGVEAARGRALAPSDARPEAPAVAVVSHGFWQSHLGGDEEVIGRSLLVNRLQVTVVGVMPAGFGFPYRQDLWVVDRPGALEFSAGVTSVVARLSPGSTVEQAAAELAVLVEGLEASQPRERERGVWIQPYIEAVVDEGPRRALALLLAAVLGLAVVACANVANLRLASAQGRRAELGIRAALGADRRRLVGKLSSESAVIVLGGGVLGLLLGSLLTAAAGRALLEGSLLRGFWMDVRVDGAVLTFAAVLCLTCFVLAGLLPAWLASREALTVDLRGAGARSQSLSTVFVAVQVGLCFALMVCAGAVGRTVADLLASELAYEGDGLLTTRVSLYQNRSLDDEGRRATFDAVLQQLRAHPEVAAATLASGAPWGWAPSVEAQSVGSNEAFDVALQSVGDRYFETLALPTLLGRAFVEADHVSGGVAVVSSSLARRFGSPEAALGQRIELEDRGEFEIVGVTPNLGPERSSSGAVSSERLFVPNLRRGSSVLLLLRARGGEATLRQAVDEEIAGLDPLAAVHAPSSFRQDRSVSSWSQRRLAQLLTLFGAVALLLAAAGLFSVVDLATRSRRREFGVRMAIGADASSVYRLVLAQAARPVAFGLALGVGLLVLATSRLEHFLEGASLWQPSILLGAGGLAVLVALAATAAPARSAARVDPAVTLKAE